METEELKQQLIDYYDRCLAFGMKCVYGDWEYKVVDNVIVGLEYLGEVVEHVDVEDWVECLGENCFYKTHRNTLISLNLNKVKYLDYSALTLLKLQKVVADELLFIGKSAFCCCKRLKSIKCDKVDYIESDAFRACSELREVHCENATSILHCAFMDCDKLEKVHIPNVVNIGNYAFAGCSSLSDVKIQNGTVLSGAAFRWCNNLKRY